MSDQGEDQLEEQETEIVDDEEEEPAAPAPPPPAPRRQPPPPIRKSKKTGVGASPAAPRRQWENRQADLLWPEIIDRYKANGKNPYNIEIRVQRLSPPPQVMVGHFSGGAVLGSVKESPGDALIRYVDDHLHIPTSNGMEAEYELFFSDRSMGAGLVARGSLTRPTPNEIMAVRRAANAIPQQQPQGYGQPQEYPQAPPPAYPPPFQQGYYPPPPHYYQPPPQASPDPAVAEALRQNAFLAGQLQAALEHMKSQGVAPPPGVAAPPQQPPIHPGWQQPPGYGQPPPPPPPAPPDPMAARRQMVADMRELKQLHEELTQMFGGNPAGVGAPAVETEEPEEPPKPEEILAFHVIEIPGTGNVGTGKPSWKFAQDKETGDVDWKGSLFANAEQLQPIAEKVIDLFGKLVNKMGQHDAATQVPQVPPAQLHGGVAGAPNGSSSGGWPTG